MSTQGPVESGLAETRIEWVEETTPGETPADPGWKAFSPEIAEFSYSTDPNKEGQDALGTIDLVEHYRATESASATLSYTQARFPVDNSGTVVDPIAYPIVTDDANDYPSLTIVGRRDVTEGGPDGGGFREFAVIQGARPVSATFDGDPSAAEPIPQELGLEAEVARTHIIGQPSTETELVVKSTDPTDTNEVVIESEDGDTTDTVTLPGSDPNTVATTETFPDVDAIQVIGEHAGDVTLGTSDGGGSIDTELTVTPLTGTNTDGVDSIEGVPALGSGSHASDITAEGPLFLGTKTTYDGGDLAPRVHTLNLTVEREVSREPRQTTRREAIDVGPRSISVDSDVGGPYQTATKIKQAFRDRSGDLVYEFGTGNITLANTEIADAPDFTRSAGDTNYIPSVTLQPSGDPAITITNTS